MRCQTMLSISERCDHSLGSHDADESGMGGSQPCMECDCPDYTATSSANRFNFSSSEAKPPVPIFHAPKNFNWLNSQSDQQSER